MRRILGLIIMMTLVFGLLPMMLPTTVEAQTYVQRYRDRYGRIRYRRVAKPSYYRRHRNRINMAVGTGAGALIGGVVGGKKGMLIGSGVGLGSSALYTYKIKPKKRKYKKIRRY